MEFIAGTTPEWWDLVVLLDGEVLPLCVYANEETGEAWCMVRNWLGQPKRRLLEHHRGRVVVWPKKLIEKTRG